MVLMQVVFTVLTGNKTCVECLYCDLEYRIAGKFGGENAWRIYSFQVFGGKKFGK